MSSLQQIAQIRLREIETSRREHKREHGGAESRRNPSVHCSRPKGGERVNKTQKEWGERDWLTFFDERAAIREHDGGLPRAQADVEAFDCCIIEWMTLNPEISKPGRCAWCGHIESTGSVIVPFGTENHGHAWLHHDCWPDWRRDRRGKAAHALTAMGLNEPTGWTA